MLPDPCSPLPVIHCQKHRVPVGEGDKNVRCCMSGKEQAQLLDSKKRCMERWWGECDEERALRCKLVSPGDACFTKQVRCSRIRMLNSLFQGDVPVEPSLSDDGAISVTVPFCNHCCHRLHNHSDQCIGRRRGSMWQNDCHPERMKCGQGLEGCRGEELLRLAHELRNLHSSSVGMERAGVVQSG